MCERAPAQALVYTVQLAEGPLLAADQPAQKLEHVRGERINATLRMRFADESQGPLEIGVAQPRHGVKIRRMTNGRKPSRMGPLRLVMQVDHTHAKGGLMIIIHSRIASRVALVLVLSAVAAPTAQARLPLALRCSSSYRPIVREELCVGARSSPGSGSVAVRPAVARTGSGFDLGDAGIGAAAGIALSALGLGGARAVTVCRTRRRIRTQVLTD